jgi:hypothetical protein
MKTLATYLCQKFISNISVYLSLSIHLLVSDVYIEQIGITKVVIHLLVPEVYIEHFGIAKLVIHLLV